jgi:hypothetical protein
MKYKNLTKLGIVCVIVFALEIIGKQMLTTQACQAAMIQLNAAECVLHDDVKFQKQKPLPAFDECVAKQHQIDTTNCPPDFRMAVLRLLAAEDALSMHIHMDVGKKSDLAVRVIFDTLDRKSPYAYADKVSDEIKHDLAEVQSSWLDLDQVAMKYGLK